MRNAKSMEPVDLQAEVKMLRNAISRLYQQSQELDDIDDQRRILGALGLAINRLCTLIKAQSGDGRQDEKAYRAAEALAQALDEVAREWDASE